MHISRFDASNAYVYYSQLLLGDISIFMYHAIKLGEICIQRITVYRLNELFINSKMLNPRDTFKYCE